MAISNGCERTTSDYRSEGRAGAYDESNGMPNTNREHPLKLLTGQTKTMLLLRETMETALVGAIILAVSYRE
ncbi:hypothetical protein KIN20_037066 [Parelaphostrongylus tenuis]|uniref:Uncharacterized protein n=1 Tax=Parelaphostrongylus tenuis TaxID=148309 RepID=A0AAD5RDE7_PARTN|nr:hypothetical protein KIN20_037066 [Parelaphostrongylus tenuis]